MANTEPTAPHQTDRTTEQGPLQPLEIAALLAIVVIWGVNNAGAKIATEVLPPMLVGGLRFMLALVCLIPFIRPPFPDPKTLMLQVLLGGPIHFGLIYLAFAQAHDLTPIAIALQLWIPFSALFAWLWLKESLSVAAMAGLGLSFAGVVVMSADGRALDDALAIGISVVASAAWAAATVLARKIRGVKPQKMQGLLALVAGPMLMLGSILFEPPMGPALAKATPLVWASIVWAGLVSTVLATGLLFWLVQRREAGRVTPYLLTTPVVSVLIGILFMGDVLTLQIVLGGSAVIGGVALVALAERRIKAAQAKQTAQIAPVGAPATEKDAA